MSIIMDTVTLQAKIFIFSDISERNNDYSDTMTKEGGEWGWSHFLFWRSLITNPQ